MREGRAGQHSNLRIATCLASDLVQQLAATFFDALRAEYHRDVAFGRFIEHRAHVLRGRDNEPRVAFVEIADASCRADRRVERHIGQKQRILVAVVDGVDDLVLHRPKQGFAAAGRRDLCERRSPSAAAEDSDLVEAHAFTPAPRTLSASGSSGQRARAGASSGSVKPAAKRSAPAQAIIAALSVQSHAGGTLKARRSRCAKSASAERIAWLAATPPATTSAGASDLPNASAVRSTRQSTIAC